MVEVFDDLLSEEEYTTLHNLISADEFRWNYSKSTIQTKYEKASNDTAQFVRCLYLDVESEPGLREKMVNVENDPYNEISRKYPEVFSIAYKALERSEREFAGIDKFLRIKANCLLPVPNRPNFHPPHLDTDADNYMSVVYYLHHTDGDTFFFPEGEQGFSVEPKPNRGVLFNSNIRHCSSNPITADRRLIINSVFLPKY